jgi:hypothetical protein
MRELLTAPPDPENFRTAAVDRWSGVIRDFPTRRMRRQVSRSVFRCETGARTPPGASELPLQFIAGF